MQGKRIERVNQLMKEEIAALLERELKDPRIGFVSVTEVEVSKDLSQAKVYVSIFGSEEEWKETFAALESAKGFIRHWLRQHLKLRVIPSLLFRPDRSMAHAAHIQGLLAQLRAREGAGDAVASAGGES